MPEQFVGRYVPNLTAKTFEISKEYVEEVEELTGSETLRKLLDEVWMLLHRLGGLMKANDWGSGVILKGKMEVVRTRHKMLGYSGLCVADAGSLKCWVVLKLNEKASSRFIDLNIFILLPSLRGLEEQLPRSYGNGYTFLTAQEKGLSRAICQSALHRFDLYTLGFGTVLLKLICVWPFASSRLLIVVHWNKPTDKAIKYLIPTLA